MSNPILRLGSKGESVKKLQKLLDNSGTLIIDGDFGSKTETTVKQFQLRYSLVADGIVGEKTWTALFAHPSNVAPGFPLPN
jgi:peptidoglycan hydrolase-like protein with peptidoglycan-binding domain